MKKTFALKDESIVADFFIWGVHRFPSLHRVPLPFLFKSQILLKGDGFLWVRIKRLKLRRSGNRTLYLARQAAAPQ